MFAGLLHDLETWLTHDCASSTLQLQTMFYLVEELQCSNLATQRGRNRNGDGAECKPEWMLTLFPWPE